MDEALIIREQVAEGVVQLTLNRPAKLNALSKDLVVGLADELERASADDLVRCVVLTGRGRAFASGADIADMEQRGLASYLDAERLRAWDAIDRFPKPIVAAVSGFALGGGCELMMLCDVVVAAKTAKLGQPETKVGALPGDGGTQRLPRLVGQSNALKMILTGEMVTADEAYRMGLVSDVVAPEDLLPHAIAIACKIAAGPPLAVQAAKKAVRLARERPLQEGLLLERQAVQSIFETADRVEGMRAFLERRPPRFQGR